MTMLAGRYELGDRLGLGGMSTVRVAYDHRLEREVAIKLLADHLAGDQQFVDRFKREALAAARLVHPNIVQVFDFGFDQESRRHYIVMERIDGPSGAQILRERGHLPPDEAVHWIEQACRGLEHAHQHGVVHRDVKPGNLLQSRADRTVKLADFGIAKAGGEMSGITQVGSVLGTAAYLAPEQATGESADPRSDLYGLGVVAYQLLSGRLPYEAASLTELVRMQREELPPPLHHLDPAIPPALAGAVERALELAPEDRFASAGEMRRAMRDGLRGIGDSPTGETRVVRPAAPATTVQPAARAPRAPRQEVAPAPVDPALPAHTRRRRSPLPWLVALTVVAAIAAAYLFFNGSKVAIQLQDVNQPRTSQVLHAVQQMVDDNTR